MSATCANGHLPRGITVRKRLYPLPGTGMALLSSLKSYDTHECLYLLGFKGLSGFSMISSTYANGHLLGGPTVHCLTS